MPRRTRAACRGDTAVTNVKSVRIKFGYIAQLSRGKKQTGSSRVLRLNNDYRELIFRLRSERLARQLFAVINDGLTRTSTCRRPRWQYRMLLS